MKKILVRIGVFMIAAAALYAAVWFAGAWYLNNLTDRWIDEQRGAGRTVDYATRDRSGFPFAWRVRLADIRMAGDAGKGRRIDWRGPYLTAEWTPLRPRLLTLISGGKHRIMVEGKDAPEQIDIGLHRIAVSTPLGRDLPRVLQMTADGITIARAGEAPSSATRLAAAATLLDPQTATEKDKPPEKARITLDIWGYTLPKNVAAPLGRTVSRLSVDAGFSGNFNPSQGRARMLSGWRDSGGVVDVRKFDADWGGVNLKTSGTLALDEELRPLAALRLDLTGMEKALDAMRQSNALRPSELLLLRFGLKALSTKSASGEEIISIPVAAQDGWLAIGPVKLVRLKPVTAN